MAKKLHSMPQMKKTDTGYEFDEKYIGQVFEYMVDNESQLIIFSKDSWAMVPANSINEMLDSIFNERLKEIEENIIKPIEENIYSKVAETISNKLKETLTTYINEHLSSQMDNINTHLDSMNETINMKVEAEDIDELLESKLPKIKTEPIINEDQITEIVSKELEVVYNNLPSIVGDIANKLIEEKAKDSNFGDIEKLPLKKIMALEELGYTLEKITEMRDKKLI